MIWYGMVWYGMLSAFYRPYGMVWYGMVRAVHSPDVKACYGMDWYTLLDHVWFCHCIVSFVTLIFALVPYVSL